MRAELVDVSCHLQVSVSDIINLERRLSVPYSTVKPVLSGHPLSSGQ